MIINTNLIDLKKSDFSLLWILKKITSKIKLLEKNNHIELKNIVYLADTNSSLKNFNIDKSLFPTENESFALIPINLNKNKIIIAYGADKRGLIYAVTELLDRIRFSTNSKNIFNLPKNLIEKPSTKIRSISKCFESNIEDLDWFHDRAMWSEYFLMLISQRFNRFTLTLGMQYNYPYGNEFIKDVYLYLAYPFLVTPKGYDIYAEGLSKAEQKKNLQTLKFISKEATRCGLDFQLAIWTQKYDFDEVPNAIYQIKKAPLKNYSKYCRDSLAMLLKECPNIKGITLRVHVECGIPEGKYDFWKIYFEAIKNAGRIIELDLHAKGIDDKLINLALEATTKVNISPKYISEHMGLPYHQASIRRQEMPPKNNVDQKWKFSEGSRKFLRYSYGDLLKEDRSYGVLYRIWPGTQRILLWGDPVLAGGYGKLSTFCDSLGVELCEPLSFKGRMGTGIKGGRFNYLDKSLCTKYDWEKYLYTYRVWGRLTYNPKTKAENYNRFFVKKFGKSGLEVSKSLAYASRILPFITLAHGVSASNNSYWPEMYENMSIVHEAPFLPYSYDLKEPSRFGMSTSCDPQLLMSPIEFAYNLFTKKVINRYSPLTIANWLENFSKKAHKHLANINPLECKRGDAEYKRIFVDIIIQASIGQFFAEKFRSACLWEYYLLSKYKKSGDRALKKYKKARDAWKIAGDISKKIYLPDLTYGPQSWLRGRWDDRLPAIQKDIDEMEKILLSHKKNKLEDTFKNNKALEIIKNWNMPQRMLINHHPPEKFSSGENILISFEANLSKRLKVSIHYRHINQSEEWQSQEVTKKKLNFSAIIPSSYTKTNFPLQYYFEFSENKISNFSPGLEDNLHNQPYFVIRQKIN